MSLRFSRGPRPRKLAACDLIRTPPFSTLGAGMLGAINRRIFGPSRAETRAAIVAYLELLREVIPGEAFDATDVGRDYEDARHAHGWPPLDVGTILRELESIGVRQFTAIRVPWAPNGSNGSPPPALPMPKPSPVDEPLTVPDDDVGKPFSNEPRTVHRLPRFTRDEALIDYRRRLDAGEVIPAQEALKKAWGCSKAAVSTWIKSWEAAGLVSKRARVREGRCNVIHLPRARKAA